MAARTNTHRASGLSSELSFDSVSFMAREDTSSAFVMRCVLANGARACKQQGKRRPPPYAGCILPSSPGFETFEQGVHHVVDLFARKRGVMCRFLSNGPIRQPIWRTLYEVKHERTLPESYVFVA